MHRIYIQPKKAGDVLLRKSSSCVVISCRGPCWQSLRVSLQATEAIVLNDYIAALSSSSCQTVALRPPKGEENYYPPPLGGWGEGQYRPPLLRGGGGIDEFP